MKLNLTSLLVGFIFAIGLGISQMTNPAKVIGFLDIFGHWDFSLAFVMIGAIGIHGWLFPMIRKRESPILAEQFRIPDRKDLHPSLIIGAALFGMGWGLGGFCPGPGLVSLASGNANSYVFVGSMLVGMMIFRWSKKFF